MKKIFAVLIIAALLIGGTCFAEEIYLFSGTQLEEGAALAVDLNGDGAAETVFWNQVPMNEYDELAEVVVQSADGSIASWNMMIYGTRVYVVDLDCDGRTEIFVTGDMMSDDYATYCLRYEGGALTQLLFADGMRGDNTGEYYDYGYGMVTAIDDNMLKLTGSQDMLGTYMCSRFLTLDGDRFEFVDDGVWCVDRTIYPLTEEEIWEYQSLTAVREIPATFYGADGEEDGIVHAGEKVAVTGGDKASVVYFQTQSGRAGYFSIAPDTANGWGYTIDGISEGDLFEYVPYAD